MIAPTHAALALGVGFLLKLEGMPLHLMVVGSLMPDIDHPQSFIGKILQPLALWFHDYFGHRKFIHSLILWCGIAFLIWSICPTLRWLAIGAITHCILDCLSPQGVQLFTPFSSVDCVFLKSNKISSGSRGDYILLVCLCVFSWLTLQVRELGGISMSLGYITGSYKMASQFLEASDRVCLMKGILRYPNGAVETGSWKIIGKEGLDGMAVWDDRQDRLLHCPADASFIACWLEETELNWNRIIVSGEPKQVKLFNANAFVLTGTGKTRQWQEVNEGDVIKGYLNYEHGIVELCSPEPTLFSFTNTDAESPTETETEDEDENIEL